MEKIVWCLLVLLSLINEDVLGQRLKGKVLSYKDSYYVAVEKYGAIKKGDKLDDEIYHDQQVLLDPTGNITDVIDYNADGTIDCQYTGRYDFSDNNYESVYVRFYPEKTIDRKPFILGSVNYSLGKMAEMNYKTDTAGRPVEEIITDVSGNILYKIEIKRDSTGNVYEEDFSDGSDFHYKYDNHGNRTEWMSHSGGDTTRAEISYDEMGNIVEINKDNYFKSKFRFHYDDFRYRYKYDEQGNWIERIDFHNGKALRIVHRTIEYKKEE
jgi:hypothetical protein